MATFENLRLCSIDEYNYFESERLDLELVRRGELYIAMHSLQKKVGDKEAIAVPLIISDLEEDKILFHLFMNGQALDKYKYTYTTNPDNFIHTSELVVGNVGADRGFLRDYTEGLDGPRPEVGAHEDVTTQDQTLVLAGR